MTDAPVDDAEVVPVAEIESLLAELGFDEGTSCLTERQATVLALRERGLEQATIAAHLGCSRANVSNIERRARDNIERARSTVSFVQLLSAPVRVELPADLPYHEAPERVYEACDAAGVKVQHGAPELIREIAAPLGAPEDRGTLPVDLVVTVTAEGEVHVLTPTG